MLRYAALLCVIAALRACSSVNRSREAAIATFEVDSLRVGDLLFRQGYSLSSHLVVVVDGNGNYSHVGVAVEHEGQMLVAHIVPDEDTPERVKIEPFSTFFSSERAISGAVCRFQTLTDEQRAPLNARILELVDLGALFDHSYNTDDHTELYCTELVCLAYSSLGWEISRGYRAEIRTLFLIADVILPSHLLNHPDLQLQMTF